MGKFQVTAPDGAVYEVEAPDNVSDEQLSAMARQVVGAPANYPVVNKSWGTKAQETAVGLVQGAANVGDHAANLMEGAYNKSLGRFLGESHSADTPAFSNNAAQLGEGNGVGKTLGEIIGTAFLTRGMGGAGTQGAAASTIMSDAQDLPGYAWDAAKGFVGGKVADYVGRGLSYLAKPVVNAGAKVMDNLGVHLTPGQIIPGWKTIEDRLTSYPFVGTAIREGRQQGYKDFNLATVEETLKPAGFKLPTGVEGRAAVKWAGDKLSSEYDALIPKLVVRGDTQMRNEVAALGQKVNNGDLSPAAVRQFETILQNQVLPRLKPGQALDGQSFRNIEKNISRQIARYGKSSEPDNQALADAFKDLQDIFQAGLQRSNPRYAKQLAALNDGWSKLVRVEGAASAAKTGVFSPAQFWNSVRAAENSVRHRGTARGTAQMQDIADAAVDTLPPSYPDSGTAGREALSVTDPRFWGGLALRPLYGPGAQSGFQKVMMSPRPPGSQTLADFLRALPAGQIGAAGAQTLPSPSGQPIP